MSNRIVAFLIAATFLPACASLPEPKTCALIGAGAGAVGGGVGGAEYAEHHDDGHAVGIGLASAAGGALLGYAVCALLREEPAPPPRRAAPTPPPPAPSPSPPAPDLDPCAGRIVLRGVNFAFDRAELAGASLVILDVVAETLDQCPNMRATVGGHTDAIGTDQYNDGLSRRRADSVKGYLVGRGIAEPRLETHGYGESRPIASNDTDEGRSMNRRVELVPID